MSFGMVLVDVWPFTGFHHKLMFIKTHFSAFLLLLMSLLLLFGWVRSFWRNICWTFNFSFTFSRFVVQLWLSLPAVCWCSFTWFTSDAWNNWSFMRNGSKKRTKLCFSISLFHASISLSFFFVFCFFVKNFLLVLFFPCFDSISVFTFCHFLRKSWDFFYFHTDAAYFLLTFFLFTWSKFNYFYFVKRKSWTNLIIRICNNKVFSIFRFHPAFWWKYNSLRTNRLEVRLLEIPIAFFFFYISTIIRNE